MLIALLSVFVLAPLLGTIIYKFQGGREVFKLDLVQFTYLFILSPILFIWIKSFLFYLLKSELNLRLSAVELFVIDTVFSVIAFYIFAAIAIHTLTKTFWLKRRDDPHFDLFHLSEYFHLWWSHIVIYVGAMTMATFVSGANLLVPLAVVSAKWQVYLTLMGGIIAGIIAFLTIWNSDPQQGNFMRIMKLFFGLFFVVQVIGYFVFDPAFSMIYGGYWFVLALFMSAVWCALFFERSSRANSWRNRFLHSGWGNNIKIK